MDALSALELTESNTLLQRAHRAFKNQACNASACTASYTDTTLPHQGVTSTHVAWSVLRDPQSKQQPPRGGWKAGLVGHPSLLPPAAFTGIPTQRSSRNSRTRELWFQFPRSHTRKTSTRSAPRKAWCSSPTFLRTSANTMANTCLPTPNSKEVRNCFKQRTTKVFCMFDNWAKITTWTHLTRYSCPKSLQSQLSKF